MTSEQRIPQPGEWWIEKGGFRYRALVLCTRPTAPESLLEEVVYSLEERPMDFRIQALVLSSFYDRFKPVIPENTNPEKDCSACEVIRDMRRAEGPKPHFIKFTRLGDPLYVRFDDIAAVSRGKVYLRHAGDTYADVNNADKVFEKALEEGHTTETLPAKDLTSLVEEPQDWYFTFGGGHLHADKYYKIHGTLEGARWEMRARFGDKWSCQYASAEAAGVEEYNLAELK